MKEFSIYFGSVLCCGLWGFSMFTVTLATGFIATAAAFSAGVLTVIFIMLLIAAFNTFLWE